MNDSEEKTQEEQDVGYLILISIILLIGPIGWVIIVILVYNFLFRSARGSVIKDMIIIDDAGQDAEMLIKLKRS